MNYSIILQQNPEYMMLFLHNFTGILLKKQEIHPNYD